MVVLVTLITTSLVACPRLPIAYAYRVRGALSQSAPEAALWLKLKVCLPVFRVVRHLQTAHAPKPHSTTVDTTSTLRISNSSGAVLVFDTVEHAEHLIVPAFRGRVQTLLEELELEGAETRGVVGS